MPAIHLKSAEFETQVINSHVPVLIDFYAEWCGPCKMLAPIIDQIADELGGAAKIFKMDVDQAQELAAKYNVMSIPNLLIFKGGVVVDQVVGVTPKEQLLEKIKDHL